MEVMRIEREGEAVGAWFCAGCEEIRMEDDVDTEDVAYECPNCGDTFLKSETDNGDHRSPCCGKFGSKAADHPCPDCKEEMEYVVGQEDQEGRGFVIFEGEGAAVWAAMQEQEAELAKKRKAMRAKMKREQAKAKAAKAQAAK